MRPALELLCLEATAILPAAGAAGPAPPSLQRGSGAALLVAGRTLPPNQCCLGGWLCSRWAVSSRGPAPPTQACVLEGQGRCRVNQPRKWPGGLGHDGLCLRKHSGDGHPLRVLGTGAGSQSQVATHSTRRDWWPHCHRGLARRLSPGQSRGARSLTLRQAWLRGSVGLTGASALALGACPELLTGT